MDVFLRVDINLTAIVLLGIICLITYQRLDLKDQLNKVVSKRRIAVKLECRGERHK